MTAARAAEIVRQKRQEGASVRLITGYFDPLLAAHARRVAELSQPGTVLLAAVTEPRSPLLALAARAELVAALRVIDYVVLPQADGFECLLAQLEPGEVFHEGAAHESIAADLIRHVLGRHAG